VQRSGTQGLGTWCAEERDLHADALACFGSPPGDVVRVWFIAVSLFQRGEGRCTWRGVELSGPGGSERVV
jgi:hypothetical protein